MVGLGYSSSRWLTHSFSRYFLFTALVFGSCACALVAATAVFTSIVLARASHMMAFLPIQTLATWVSAIAARGLSSRQVHWLRVQSCCGSPYCSGLNLCPLLGRRFLSSDHQRSPTDIFELLLGAPKLVFAAADTLTTCGVLAPPAMGFLPAFELSCSAFSHVQLFATQGTAASQASCPLHHPLLKLMSIELLVVLSSGLSQPAPRAVFPGAAVGPLSLDCCMLALPAFRFAS